MDPAKHDFAFESAPSGYGGDGSGYLKISFDGGEIDFIIAQPRTDAPFVIRDIDGRPTLLETVPEIITKKVYYRNRSIRPRDIFDIAAAAEHDAASLVAALSRYPEEVSMALENIERLNPHFVREAIGQLMIREKFKPFAETSLQRARELLVSV